MLGLTEIVIVVILLLIIFGPLILRARKEK